MTQRFLRGALCVAGFVVACGRAPVANDAEAGISPSEQPIPGHDGDPGRRVWTTRPNADACEEFRASEAPLHSLFETRAECQDWVAQRKCKPGHCFDGCNGVTCDATGMHGGMTALECIVEVEATLEFQLASPEPVASPPPELAKVERELELALRAPGRKVFVIGHAANEEAETDEGREKLRAERAEVVRGLLIAAGLPGDRLFSRTRASLVPEVPFPTHGRFVSFELDPADPQRTDAMARSRRGDRPWCD